MKPRGLSFSPSHLFRARDISCCPYLPSDLSCCRCPLQVDRSNALAQARAADNTLVNLIDQGQASIASNQAAIMEQLAVIIGKQVSA